MWVSCGLRAKKTQALNLFILFLNAFDETVVDEKKRAPQKRSGKCQTTFLDIATPLFYSSQSSFVVLLM
jgi:hypothetical protein